MVTEMITLKLDKKFLKDIDSTVKQKHYHNRTEFIRAALREKLEKEEIDNLKKQFRKIRGASRRKTTDEELERIKEKVGNEILRKMDEDPEGYEKEKEELFKRILG